MGERIAKAGAGRLLPGDLPQWSLGIYQMLSVYIRVQIGFLRLQDTPGLLLGGCFSKGVEGGELAAVEPLDCDADDLSKG